MDLKKYIRSIQDYPKKGILFRDITTLIKNEEAFREAINQMANILIIDDLIATGGTSEAGAKLVERSGGIVSGFLFVINLFDLGGCDNLIKKGYKVENLMDFPGH